MAALRLDDAPKFFNGSPRMAYVAGLVKKALIMEQAGGLIAVGSLDPGHDGQGLWLTPQNPHEPSP